MFSYQTYLAEQLIERKKKNPLYSLRAFSKALDMSPSHLSSIIGGRKIPSPQLARKIFERLNTDSLLAQKMIKDLVAQDSTTCFKAHDLEILPEDQYEMISTWAHFAILSLAHIKDNKANSKWISDRLGINPQEALECFNRLQRMGFIEVTDGQFKQTTKPLHTKSDVYSASVRAHHKAHLQLAAEKIETIPLELREFSAITVDVDMKKLPQAKKMIQEFKLDLSEFLCKGKTSEVYTLAIQLFPLTRLKNHEN